MKSFKRLLCIWVVVLGLVGCAMFKTKYNPGTVTLKDGTVLEGSTFIITNYSFKFRDAKTGKKRSIRNDDVQSLTKKFDNGNVAKYETLSCGGRNILVRIIVSGELSVYQYQIKRTKTRFVSNGVVPYDYIEVEWYLQKRNELCILHKETGLFRDRIDAEFKTFATIYFADTPEIANKIGSEGYNYNDIIKIAKEYNLLKSKQ